MASAPTAAHPQGLSESGVGTYRSTSNFRQGADDSQSPAHSRIAPPTSFFPPRYFRAREDLGYPTATSLSQPRCQTQLTRLGPVKRLQ